MSPSSLKMKRATVSSSPRLIRMSTPSLSSNNKAVADATVVAADATDAGVAAVATITTIVQTTTAKNFTAMMGRKMPAVDASIVAMLANIVAMLADIVAAVPKANSSTIASFGDSNNQDLCIIM